LCTDRPLHTQAAASAIPDCIRLSVNATFVDDDEKAETRGIESQKAPSSDGDVHCTIQLHALSVHYRQKKAAL
jgi:hypothetical protein